jgi:hypothetical protein
MKTQITISDFKQQNLEVLEHKQLIANYECRCNYYEIANHELFIAFTILEIKNKNRSYNIIFKNFNITSDTGSILNNWEGFCYQLFDKLLDIKS